MMDLNPAEKTNCWDTFYFQHLYLYRIMGNTKPQHQKK
jgi:hypothetical protein